MNDRQRSRAPQLRTATNMPKSDVTVASLRRQSAKLQASGNTYARVMKAQLRSVAQLAYS